MNIEYLKDGEYRRRLFLLFSQAKQLDIAVYSFTAAAGFLKFLKGKEVRIILDAGSRTEDDRRKVAQIKRTLSTVAKVRTKRNTHLKLYIADKKKCILGSMNISRNSIWNSHEAGIEITNERFIEKVSQHFNEIWKEAK